MALVTFWCKVLDCFSPKRKNRRIIDKLKEKGLQFQLSAEETRLESTILEGKKILASGRLNHFKRDEIMDFVAAHGGHLFQVCF